MPEPPESVPPRDFCSKNVRGAPTLVKYSDPNCLTKWKHVVSLRQAAAEFQKARPSAKAELVELLETILIEIELAAPTLPFKRHFALCHYRTVQISRGGRGTGDARPPRKTKNQSILSLVPAAIAAKHDELRPRPYSAWPAFSAFFSTILHGYRRVLRQ